MRILQIHHYFHILGGAEKYFFDVSSLLERHGHQIAYFSVKNKENLISSWSKYFLSAVDYENKSLASRIKWAERSIYSVEARKRIINLLAHFRPDLVHIHHIDQLISSSILPELAKFKIPIIQTVHDYRLISPLRNLYHDGAICEATKRNRFYKLLTHRCVPITKSTSYMLVAGYYLNLLMKFNSHINYFIAPSQFMVKKMVDYGFDSEKIIHLPYFTNIPRKILYTSKNKCNYILYFGRLVPEKGLEKLIEAMKNLPDINLRIAGRGSAGYEKKLQDISRVMKNIELLGFQDGIRLQKLIRESRFTVLPSVWYEVFGISILESFAYGKPVIASKIGGIPEIVKDGTNGLLFGAGNVAELTIKIKRLWKDKPLCLLMGKNAYCFVKENFGEERHYRNLLRIYNRTINNYSIK